MLAGKTVTSSSSSFSAAATAASYLRSRSRLTSLAVAAVVSKFITLRSIVTVNPQSINSKSDDENGSIVYRQALKFQSPPFIKPQPHLHNTAQFIGTIVTPVETCKSVAFSKLAISSPSSRNPARQPRVGLDFKGKMAGIAMQHLKIDDCVYVSGPLAAVNLGTDDAPFLYYKVIVKELNFIEENFPEKSLQNNRFSGQIGPQATSSFRDDPSEDMEQVDEAHLWQEFFFNPEEWWDNRKNKKYDKAADFVHKSTRESLWIRPSNPPWVKGQLERLDSLTLQRGKRKNRGFSQWDFYL